MHQSWFEKLTGFPEQTPEEVRAKLVVEGPRLTSLSNGRSMVFGRLETPTLAALSRQAAACLGSVNALTVGEEIADVRTIHTRPEAAGALFQVASQFNLLEMVSPTVTPEAGVSIYAHDLTQGPACAIAAGAGTIYRNYFVPIKGQLGQSAEHQIDCLESVGDVLGNRSERYWSMENGYAQVSEEGLKAINNTMADLKDGGIDEIRGALRIGLQWDTEVTLNDCGHLVTHAYCSALPVAYSMHSIDLWEPFARLILDATYEATLAAAILNSENSGNRRVFLTLVGGGAFGNRVEWIISAIGRALRLFSGYPLEVKVVSYRHPNPHLLGLMQCEELLTKW